MVQGHAPRDNKSTCHNCPDIEPSKNIPSFKKCKLGGKVSLFKLPIIKNRGAPDILYNILKYYSRVSNGP